MAPIIYLEATMRYIAQTDLDRFQKLSGEIVTTKKGIKFFVSNE